MIEIHRCPICDGNTFIPFTSILDHSISREKFTLNKCRNCELLITSPRPSNNQLDKYYTSPAYTSHISTAKNIIDKVYLTARNFTLKWKLSLIEKNTFDTSEKKLFDFGCGTGEFLKAAKLHGWQIAGMEPSPFARQQSDPAIRGDIQPSMKEFTNENKKFQVITLWHVLEHVEDLNTTLQELKRLLVESGTIFIAVPNHTSWDAKHYKQNWAGFDVPRHFWHFSMKSMTRLLEKHALTVVKIIPMRLDAFYISLLSEKYRNNDQVSILGLMKAFFKGLLSNHRARKNMEYSSLIYVVKK
ncbi:MAG TPA: class I SAM-dependent methyltransferase [Chryseolinea sp.]|nr:class I SAM-dependent methyltransferase [Chryseolinea sp.]